MDSIIFKLNNYVLNSNFLERDNDRKCLETFLFISSSKEWPNFIKRVQNLIDFNLRKIEIMASLALAKSEVWARV